MKKAKWWRMRIRFKTGRVILLTFVAATIFFFSAHQSHGQDIPNSQCKRGLRVATWNLAAVNNNPFEYWITYPDPKYIELMNGVQEFLSNPGAMDVAVHDVFSDSMAKNLFADMAVNNAKGLSEVEKRWSDEYRSRKIISGFLKDKSLGKKRLTSMPDRVTNTINTADGGKALRPTVINCVATDIQNLSAWWQQWRDFMFVQQVTIVGKKGGEERLPFELLQPIQRSKYPDITVEEESVSIPLQALCLAIFDAILVHMMAHLAASSWQPIRSNICAALNRNKDAKIMNILKTTYMDAHVAMLQETAPSFVRLLEQDQEFARKFLVFSPAGASSMKRDQNSIVLLDKGVIASDSVLEVTHKILKYDSTEAISTPGDVLALLATTKGNQRLLLVSFHGDTNGLATKPLVKAILKAIEQREFGLPRPALILGMDGNTYKEHSMQYQGVLDLQQLLLAHGLSSVWGDNPDPLAPTTSNARTYLQPQLNKAVGKAETFTKGDVNLKDWIVFFQTDFSVVNGSTTRDNTGKAEYIDKMVYPTLDFPSDHAVVAATLTSLTHSHLC